MTLLVRPHAPDARGVVTEITPQSAGWQHVGFSVVRLADGDRYDGQEAERETCLVILSGHADLVAGEIKFSGLGDRSDVFEGAPDSVYLPAGQAYALHARGPVELAICTAPGSGRGAITRISPEMVGLETRGQETNTRYVRNILPDSSTIAEKLLVVEVITPSGHWSSYPPHKHDVDDFPGETLLEETYYHRLSPPQGFAFQRVYTDDRSIDETMTVSDGDVVMVPRGYHPVGAAHGYDLYYLNVMAGPMRAWRFANDPEHEWIAKPQV